MSKRWFWAWLRLKQLTERGSAPFEDKDWTLTEALITAITSSASPSGDGKFSRLSNYIEKLSKAAEFCRQNWQGTDELLSAFILGVETVIESLKITAEKIKRG